MFWCIVDYDRLLKVQTAFFSSSSYVTIFFGLICSGCHFDFMKKGFILTYLWICNVVFVATCTLFWFVVHLPCILWSIDWRQAQLRFCLPFLQCCGVHVLVTAWFLLSLARGMHHHMSSFSETAAYSLTKHSCVQFVEYPFCACPGCLPWVCLPGSLALSLQLQLCL